ncbi:hypothetical protein J3R30DRAFT_1675998 [Lentinula aciculospora]|uniref:PH domain-containing protein n=1 Tax=Lentinula aciculospora TaxID=153920 RepID=A0A9W8ZWR9_9AGAR|nr:hypothetical protein J3R30DRAFT_1675998 [Lentinula aciculospora]
MGPRPLGSRDSRRSFTGLQSHGSAKQLIELYEHRQQTIPSTPPSSSLRKPSSPSPRQKKDKSPIRQSFSKVIGLFKKGTSSRQIRDLTPLQSTPSGSRLSGPLLYLSRNESDCPIWTPCTAALESGNLQLTYSTPCTNFNSYPIQLKCCSDVRSLSTCEIPDDELILLRATAAGHGDPRLFELVFDGATEKFAAPSVTDRASWVSTIWDSILLMQESKSVYRFEDSEKLHSTRLETSLTMPIADLSKPLPPPLEERSLPDLPPPSDCDFDNVPAFFCAPLKTLDDFPNIQPERDSLPCSIPPIIAHSLSVPPTSTQSLRSTSIANLSKRSMVKQRLAQMEKDHSQDFSPVSPRRNRPLPSPLSPRKDQCTYRTNPTQAMQRTNTSDSIVDSYSYSNQTALASTPLWTQSAMTPIAEDDRSEVSGTHVLHNAFPLRVDTRAEVLYPSKAEIESSGGFPIQPQADHDTGGPIAAQEVQNSEQMIALNDIRHTLSDVDKKVSNTTSTLLSIDQILEELRNRIDSTVSESYSNMSGASVQDMTGIQKSLDGLQVLLTADVVDALKRLEEDSKSRASRTSESSACYSNLASSEIQTQLTDALALLRDQNEKNAERDLLQTDSVRYLNELNVWLESFVNGGTAQIQMLSTMLQQVLHSFGAIPSPDGVQAPGEGEFHYQDNAALRTPFPNAIGHLNGRGGASDPLSTQAVFELIERQKQDHEGLLRLLTSELSNEIKGERLRFVEAMKEATAINVQAHVDEFKKELKREVRGMTQEVGRLHQEKQSIENQIADLFAFYSKQAKNGGIPPGSVPAFEEALSSYSTPQRGRGVGGVGGLRTPQPSPERRRRNGF